MVQIAFLGCAHIHTPGFRKQILAHPEITCKTVWDHDAERAKKNAGEFGCAVSDSIEAILTDDEIEAIVVCSETDRHEELTLATVAAGKHLFVEKPLGFAATDAYRIAREIEKAGLIFQTGYFMRGMPVHLFLKQQIESGAFGTITRVRHSNCHAGALNGWFDTEWRWMADPAVAGCGGFGDLGTHVLDILLWLFGSVDRCTATIREVTGRYPGCDETGEAILQFSNGIIGTFAAGWLDVNDPVRLAISGTEGQAVVFKNKLYFKSQHVEGADGEQPWTELPEALPHAFAMYLDTIAGKTDLPLVKPSEAAYRNAVMDALYAASDSQTWVEPITA